MMRLTIRSKEIPNTFIILVIKILLCEDIRKAYFISCKLENSVDKEASILRQNSCAFWHARERDCAAICFLMRSSLSEVVIVCGSRKGAICRASVDHPARCIILSLCAIDRVTEPRNSCDEDALHCAKRETLRWLICVKCFGGVLVLVLGQRGSPVHGGQGAGRLQ